MRQFKEEKKMTKEELIQCWGTKYDSDYLAYLREIFPCLNDILLEAYWIAVEREDAED